MKLSDDRVNQLAHQITEALEEDPRVDLLLPFQTRQLFQFPEESLLECILRCSQLIGNDEREPILFRSLDQVPKDVQQV